MPSVLDMLREKDPDYLLLLELAASLVDVELRGEDHATGDSPGLVERAPGGAGMADNSCVLPAGDATIYPVVDNGPRGRERELR